MKLMSPTTTDSLIRVLQALFATHGIPDILVSDNGQQLMAGPFEVYLAGQGIRHILTAPFHPVSNGWAVNEVLSKLGPVNWHTKIARYLLLPHATPCP